MEKKKCTDAAIALGGVSDRAIRVEEAEKALIGKEDVGLEDLDRASTIAADLSKPASDFEVSESYKKKMVRVLVRRALTRASGAAK